MTLKVGSTVFDSVSYDRHGDVLYLHVGVPRAAAYGEATPEGHALRFDRDGHVIGLTIVGASTLLERDGVLAVTMPERIDLSREEIAPAFAQTSPPIADALREYAANHPEEFGEDPEEAVRLMRNSTPDELAAIVSRAASAHNAATAARAGVEVPA
jgi:uncharacterized protein YuzE